MGRAECYLRRNPHDRWLRRIRLALEVNTHMGLMLFIDTYGRCSENLICSGNMVRL